MYYSVNIYMWQKTFFSRFQEAGELPLTATILACWAVVFYMFLQSSALYRHSGIDWRKLFLCDIIVYNLSLYYFKWMFLELAD